MISSNPRHSTPARPPHTDGHNLWTGNHIAGCSTEFLCNCLDGLATAIEQDRESAHLYCGRIRKIVVILRGRTSLSLPREAPAREEG